ncbi:hypothetical protein FHX74_003453 [Friedmanniella endophytica]|uniref:Uncharacterized protein n=1 Tax=Microlunatus kandeliicorticis TaxID=1759536 RepID=A0A7W3IV49_9ACTN|nr:hypothetical protein [Microlunatus kandeliicorticis]
MAALSKPVLVRLSALPRVVVPLLMVALAAVGLFAPVPVAVVALVALILFVGWLAYLSWPLLSTGSRALRVMMLVLLIGYGVLRVTR